MHDGMSIAPSREINGTYLVLLCVIKEFTDVVASQNSSLDQPISAIAGYKIKRRANHVRERYLEHPWQ